MNGVTGMTNLSPDSETPNSWPQHVARALPCHVDSRYGADGLPGGAWFGRVSAVVALEDGRVVVLHRGPAIEPVVIFDRDGQFLSSWDADIGLPHGMRIDPDGHLWITDVSRHRVIKTTLEGRVLMELGRPDQPGVDEGMFNKPTDIAFGADGTVYVSDGYGNSRIVAFDAEGRFLRTWGQPGSGPEEFDTPHAVVVAADGLVWVSDRGNGRISSFEPDGRLVRSWSHLGAAQSLAFSQDGSLWVMAYRTQTEIIDYDSQGGRLMLVEPSRGSVVASLEVPGHCVHEAADGNVYVASLSGSVLQVRPGWKIGVDVQRDATETTVSRWSDLT
jgi:DNA-binding beta-propeller fold protein YncE